VNVSVVSYKPASTVSSYSSDSSSFQVVANAINDLFSEAILAPNLLVGATDTKHYEKLSANIYRFSPIRLALSQTSMFHGLNEKISLKAYENVFQFYYRVTQTADAEGSR